MKETLYKIIGGDKVKNNKLYFIFKILLSLFFAVTIFLDNRLVFNGSIFSNIKDSYFKKIDLASILVFVGVLIGTYLLITFLEYLSDKIEKTIYTKKQRRDKNIKVYIIILAILLVCWISAVLSYFPGGIYADTVTSINEGIISNHITNHNPILYTLILKAFLIIGLKISSYPLGIKLFTVFQIIVMAALISYLIYWLYKRKVSTKYIILLTVFFGIFRLIPMYAISIWKDTPFGLALFVYTIFIAETVYQKGENLDKIGGILKYIILLLLVCFLRNNGVYVVIVTTIALMAIYKKRICSIASAIAIILTLIIQGPIYTHFNMNTETVENLGVPLQQICYVVAKDDGILTDQQREFINNLCGIETIKQNYNPYLVDSIKWNSAFNNEFLSQNKVKFIKVWAEILIKNPVSYVKAYLLNTLGFWDINKATMDAYINPKMWNNVSFIQIGDIQLQQKDYIQIATGHSIQKIVTPSKPISSAVFLFIILFSVLITMYKKQYKNLLIYLPALLTWATIMVAAPLAFSLRYVYILVLVTPMAFLIPFLKPKDLTENKEKEVKKNGKKE